MHEVRVLLDEKTRKRLRQIAAETDETMYEVMERLAAAEQQRLNEKDGRRGQYVNTDSE